MHDENKIPALSFHCPKEWASMPGSEAERFCDQCGHSVQNLSLMDASTRRELLALARTKRVCGTFIEDLSGNLITAKSPEQLSQKVHALKLAAVASGAIALSSCSQNQEKTYHPIPPQPSSNFQTMGIMCPPDAEDASEMPITGPSEPPSEDGILRRMMDRR